MANKRDAIHGQKLRLFVDKLNPDLWLTEKIDGKCHIREFYAMTLVDAFSVLEAIAEINGYCYRLKKRKAAETE